MLDSKPENASRRLAIFDLDNTLLGGDSDHAWGEFLIAEGRVEANRHRARNDAFYADYQNGALDIDAYLRFVLATVAGKTPAEIEPLLLRFVQQTIEPLRLPLADSLLDTHRARGDQLLIITATSEFITRPIADLLGVEALLASRAELVEGRYSGAPSGTPCYREGKVERLGEWLADKNFSLEDACFYSDSHNDVALLSQVGEAVAVDPDPTLRAHAKALGWRITSLRN
ncbi:MAG: HAD family hydrolase [Pseudomonadales bacterium]